MKKYLVNRGIEADGKYRFEAGEIVSKGDIKGAPIAAWLRSGVLTEVEDDEREELED